MWDSGTDTLIRYLTTRTLIPNSINPNKLPQTHINHNLQPLALTLARIPIQNQRILPGSQIATKIDRTRTKKYLFYLLLITIYI